MRRLEKKDMRRRARLEWILGWRFGGGMDRFCWASNLERAKSSMAE